MLHSFTSLSGVCFVLTTSLPTGGSGVGGRFGGGSSTAAAASAAAAAAAGDRRGLGKGDTLSPLLKELYSTVYLRWVVNNPVAKGGKVMSSDFTKAAVKLIEERVG